MKLFDCGVLVLQLAIIAIGAVTAAVTRTRQEYNEYHMTLEDFPNPESPWPLILVVAGSGMVWLGEVYWALASPRAQALLFLSVLLLQIMTIHAAARQVLAGFQETE
jgi:hypothetical protein